jgi:hypothetical protein
VEEGREEGQLKGGAATGEKKKSKIAAKKKCSVAVSAKGRKINPKEVQPQVKEKKSKNISKKKKLSCCLRKREEELPEGGADVGGKKNNKNSSTKKNCALAVSAKGGIF